MLALAIVTLNADISLIFSQHAISTLFASTFSEMQYMFFAPDVIFSFFVSQYVGLVARIVTLE